MGNTGAKAGPRAAAKTTDAKAGYAGPRTECPLLRYHIGRMNELYSLENGIWVYHGERVDAKMAADMGDMMGAMNSSDDAQYGVDTPYPTDANSGPPFPWPPTGTPPPSTVQPNYTITTPFGEYVPRIETASNGGFTCEQIWCIAFTLPADATGPYPVDGKADVAEYQGPTVFRQINISATPGDFRADDPTGANGPFLTASGSRCGVPFNVGQVPPSNIIGAIPPAPLVAGRTYYINIRNWSNDLTPPGNGCLPGSATNAAIQVSWPK